MNRLMAAAIALSVGFGALGFASTPVFAQAQKPGPQNCSDIKDSKMKQECVQKAAKAKQPEKKAEKAAAPAKK